MLCQVDAFKRRVVQTARNLLNKSWFALWIGWIVLWTVCQTVMPDDHSKLVPLLPIPNRTVKRLSADDSADSCVKVGHRQAIKSGLAQLIVDWLGFFFRWEVCFFVCTYWQQVQTKKFLNYLTRPKKSVYTLRLSWLQHTTKASC